MGSDKFCKSLNAADMQEQGHRIASITDNAPTHPPPTKPPLGYVGSPLPATLDRVKVIYIPPNIPAWLQPLGAGIVCPLKAGNRQRFAKYMINYLEKYGTVAPNSLHDRGGMR